MRAKYMVVQIEPQDSLDEVLARMATSGWRVKTHVPTTTSAVGGKTTVHMERIILEKVDQSQMSDAEMEALSVMVRAEMMNHEIQASMAAKNGDYFPFSSPTLDTLMREIRKRGLIE